MRYREVNDSGFVPAGVGADRDEVNQSVIVGFRRHLDFTATMGALCPGCIENDAAQFHRPCEPTVGAGEIPLHVRV